MSGETIETLDQWRQDVLRDFTDHRIVDALWVDVHLWFFLHLYADLAKSGTRLEGFSLRDKQDMWLLVLKVTQADLPLVGFVSGSTPTSCMRKLRDRLRKEEMVWSADRYR